MYKLSRVEASLADVAGEMSAQGSRLEKLRGFIDLSIDELEQRFSATSTESPVQSRTFADIKSELQRLKTKREELLTLYTEKHPDVIAVDNQITDLRVQLRQEVANAYELAVSQYDEISAKYESLLREKRQTESDISALPDKQRELGADREQYPRERGEVSASPREAARSPDRHRDQRGLRDDRPRSPREGDARNGRAITSGSPSVPY